MLGYSRNREDYISKLVEKYRENPFSSVSKSKMREAIFVEGDSCSKCHVMKPHCEKRCGSNGYDFNVFRFDDISVKEFDVQSVPMLILKENGEVKQILNEEGIVNLISNKS